MGQINLSLCAISCSLFVEKSHSETSCTYLLLILAILQQLQDDIPGLDQSLIVCYFLIAIC